MKKPPDPRSPEYQDFIRQRFKVLDRFTILLIYISLIIAVWALVDAPTAPKHPYVQDGTLVMAKVQQECFTCTPVGVLYRGTFTGWPCRIETQ